jgi:hypothetical protein
MQVDIFKNVVEEITPLEKSTILPMLIDTLAFRTKEDMISSSLLSNWLKASGYNIPAARVRKILAWASGANIKQGATIHLGNKIIIACSKGYFVTGELNDVDNMLDDLVRRRKSLDFRIQGVQAQRLSLKHLKTA